MSKLALGMLETFLTLFFILLFAMNAIVACILTIAIIAFDLMTRFLTHTIAQLAIYTIAASCWSLQSGSVFARSMLRFATNTHIGVTIDCKVFFQYSYIRREMHVVSKFGKANRTTSVTTSVATPVPPIEQDDGAPNAPLARGGDEPECATTTTTTTTTLYKEVWRDVFFAGTEWSQLKQVAEYDWDFDHLDAALNKGGDLEGKKVHLFGVTEPQLVDGSVLLVPAIVVVECKHPPPSLVGITSVQRSCEEIVPMRALEMSWHAHVPNSVLGHVQFEPRVHMLKCVLRRARLATMEEATVCKYDYVLPYISRPHQNDDNEGNDDDITLETEVQVFVKIGGRSAPLLMEYDIELDDLDEFVAAQVKSSEDLVADDHSEVIRSAIKKAVSDAKLKFEREKAARRKLIIDQIPQHLKRSIKHMRLIKFYPQNMLPDLTKFKSKFVNRYYGQANIVR